MANVKKKTKSKKTKKAVVPKRKYAVKNKKSRKPAKAKKQIKPVGEVAHFYGHIGVAIVKFNQKVPAGTELHFKGATTDFKEAAKSMQYDHADIDMAPKGKQVGVKVAKKVREGDLVYKAE